MYVPAMSSRPRVNHAAGATTLLIAVLLLTACASDDGPPAESGVPSIAESREPQEPDVEPTTEAVESSTQIVVASMDVGGLTATVSGYVSGVVETGGECTYTLTGPGPQVILSAEGFANASTTSCGAIEVPAGQLSRGQWSVVLDYSHRGNTVTGEPALLEVP